MKRGVILKKEIYKSVLQMFFTMIDQNDAKSPLTQEEAKYKLYLLVGFMQSNDLTLSPCHARKIASYLKSCTQLQEDIVIDHEKNWHRVPIIN